MVEEATCNVAVLRLDGDGTPEQVLVPTAGGPHARLAVEVASAFLAANPGTHLTLLTFAGDHAESARQRLQGEVDRLAEQGDISGSDERITLEVRPGTGDVATDIVIFAESAGVDTIVIGATREGRVRQALLGAIPETVGERFSGRVLMVKRYRPIEKSLASWFARWFGWRSRAET